MYDKYGLKSVFLHMFCAFIKHKEDMGYRSSIRIVYVFRELEASWASNWPTEIVFTKQLYDLWKGARLNEAETTVYHKISIIRQFCKYMGYCGLSAYVPSLPKRTSHRYIPKIFTNEELSRIFRAVDALRSGYVSTKTSLWCMPTLFRLLYATGMRIGEALTLKNADVNLDSRVITLRTTKNDKDRLIPMSDSIVLLLKQYCGYRDRMLIKRVSTPDSHFFPSFKGTRMKNTTPEKWFRKTLHSAGIPFIGGTHGPRVHDLRHTFAVHTLMNQARAGKDIYSILPLLSVFLGHKHLASTETYVRLTCEMFPEINEQVSAVTSFIFPTINHIIHDET